MARPDEEYTLLLSVKTDMERQMKAAGASSVREFHKMEAGLEGVEGGLREVGRQATRSFGRVKAAAAGAMRFLGRTMRHGLLSIAGAVVAVDSAMGAARGAADFEQAMAEVHTILPPTVQDVDDLSAAVLSLSTAQGQLRGDVAGGLYQAISAGFSDAGSGLQVVEGAGRLATASLSDTNTAVDLLTTTLNAYGESVEMVDDILDIYFTTVREGKTTLDELAASVGRALPIASTLGVRLQEVTAAYAAQTQQGIDTAQSTTNITSLFKSLLKEADKIDEVFRRVGKRYDLNTVKSEGLVSTLFTLRDALVDDAEALDVLGGRMEATTALLALTGNAGERFVGALDKIEHGAGNVDAAIERAFGTDESKIRRVWNALSNEVEKFGATVNEVAAGVIDDLGGVEDVNNAIGGTFDALRGVAESQLRAVVKEVERFAGVWDVAAASVGVAKDQVDLMISRAELGLARFGDFLGLTDRAGRTAALSTLAAGKGFRPDVNPDVIPEFAALRAELDRIERKRQQGLIDSQGFDTEGNQPAIEAQARIVRLARELLEVEQNRITAGDLAVAQAEARLAVSKKELANAVKHFALGEVGGPVQPPGARGAASPGPDEQDVAAVASLGPILQRMFDSAAGLFGKAMDALSGGGGGVAKAASAASLQTDEQRLEVARIILQLEGDTATKLEDKLDVARRETDMAREIVRLRLQELGATEAQLESVNRLLDQQVSLREGVIRSAHAQESADADLVSSAKSVNRAFVDATSDVFVGFIEGVKSGKEAFADFTRQVLSDIIRIGAQLAALKLIGLTPLGGLGAAFADGGIVPGGIGKLHSLPVHAYSDGGIVSRPQVAVMGEGGEDEAVVPLKHGAIPVKNIGGGRGRGGGVNVTVNMPVHAIDARSLAERIVELSSAVGAAVRKELTGSTPFRAYIRAVGSGGR